jgi:hypothetical protein
MLIARITRALRSTVTGLPPIATLADPVETATPCKKPLSYNRIYVGWYVPETVVKNTIRMDSRSHAEFRHGNRILNVGPGCLCGRGRPATVTLVRFIDEHNDRTEADIDEMLARGALHRSEHAELHALPSVPWWSWPGRRRPPGDLIKRGPLAENLQRGRQCRRHDTPYGCVPAGKDERSDTDTVTEDTVGAPVVDPPSNGTQMALPW